MNQELKVAEQLLKVASEIKLAEQKKVDSFQFEKNKLYSILGEGLVKLFKKYELIVAGGTITSLFINKEINDIDIYARNQDAAIAFMEDIWSVHIVSNTNKAVQFMKYESLLQLIHFNFFDTPEDIFETFDYTVCMGAFDFKTEEFVLHKDFMKHNSQRILKFNNKTAFPIVSMLRVQKYEDKGFKISKPEFIRVVLTCMNLNITSYAELKDHLGGMYGQAYEKLFEDMKDEDFNLEEAVDKIANLALSEDYFKEPESLPFDDLDDIIDNIAKVPFKYIELFERHYKVGYKDSIRQIHKIPDSAIKLDAEEYVKDLKIYKFVKKEDSVYSSFYKNSFTYELNKEISGEGEYSEYSGSGRLYFNSKDGIESSTYYNKDNKVLIEATVNKDDIVRFGHQVEVKKAFITREVPELEWKEWIGEVVEESEDLLI